MITLFFLIALAIGTWRMLVFAIKAAWGIFKLLGTVLLLPIVLAVLFFMGLIYIAVPALIVFGIIAVAGSFMAE